MDIELHNKELRIASAPMPIQSIPQGGMYEAFQKAFANCTISFQIVISQIEESAQNRFNRLAEEWRKDTRAVSVLKRKVRHPAYQQIIQMQWEAVPLILRELSERPDDWFPALYAITGQDPVSEGSTFDQAVEAWLAWGKAKHLLR